MYAFISVTTEGGQITHPLKACELCDVDMHHVAWPCSLTAAHWLCRLQVLEPAEPQNLEHPANGGWLCHQHSGNSSGRAALMAEVNCVLQLR
jgi:hypothetical protein